MDLRALPSVATLLDHPEGRELSAQFSRAMVTRAIRGALEDTRREMRTLGESATAPSEDILLSRVQLRLLKSARTTLPRVVNATGIVLHTNLGRSLLSREAQEAMVAAATNPVALEFDLGTGRRGQRDNHIRESLRALTGAADALAVNNNAAALMLAVDTIANRREVIVSRGELIEIGGSFRLPDILRRSGAILREVGTTNRTHLSDIADAITRRTALILRAHPSNYRITGFTEMPHRKELVTLAKKANVPLMEDLGSGALLDLSSAGLPDEPIVRTSIESGVDLVSFSGDKLMGGPQAGLLAGRADLIEGMNKNPLKRALRLDKITLAALRATLVSLECNPEALATLPMMRFLMRTPEAMAALARESQEVLRNHLGGDFTCTIVESTAEVGSGAQPTLPIPSKAIAIVHKSWNSETTAAFFRNAETPILGRIRQEEFRLELHAVEMPTDLLPMHAEPPQ